MVSDRKFVVGLRGSEAYKLAGMFLCLAACQGPGVKTIEAYFGKDDPMIAVSLPDAEKIWKWRWKNQKR